MTMTFNNFKLEFLNWMTENIEPKQKDVGFSICPYAKKARLQNKIQFIDCSDGDLNKILNFNQKEYDICIVWLKDNIKNVNKNLKYFENKNPDLLYMLSTKHSGNFVKNFTNCIFIQNKKDIENKRNYLMSLGYYKNWPSSYYEKIINNL